MSLSHSNCWDISTFSGEGNGKPLQYSCLENPVDRGAWWAAVHRVAQDWTRLKRLSIHACIGEKNGNPLQYCLVNPRDTGAWWAAVYGVAQSQTRLKWLSSSSSIDICVCVCVCVCECACSCLLPSTLLNPKSEYLSILESKFCLFHICKFSSGPVPAI